MKNIGDKIDNTAGASGELSASEFNDHKNELQEAVERTGQTLSDAKTPEQLGRAQFITGVGAAAMQDSGTADAIQITPVTGANGLIFPETLTELSGAVFEFIKTTINTSGVITVNVGQDTGSLLPSKNLVLDDGTYATQPDPGTVVGRLRMQYNLANDIFVLLDASSYSRLLSIEQSKQLDERFYIGSSRAPAAWDWTDPASYFPAVSLDEGDQDLDVANWPELVPYLLAKALTYNEGIGGEKSAFDVTDWVVASNVGTLTFANTTPELKALAALVEDNLVQGSFASWRSVTLAGSIGNIPAGTYALDAIDAVARTITFDVTASNGSGSVTETVQFLIHAIEGSADARVFEYPAGVLVAANDSDGEAFAGLRRRDRTQGWQLGTDQDNTGAREYWGRAGGRDATADTSGSANRTNSIFETTAEGSALMLKAKSDGTNGTPRTGLTTDPRSYVGKLYLWGRRFIA